MLCSTSAASDDEMEQFYNSLQDTLDSVPNRDVKIIMDDFNAKVRKLKTANLTVGNLV